MAFFGANYKKSKKPTKTLIYNGAEVEKNKYFEVLCAKQKENVWFQQLSAKKKNRHMNYKYRAMYTEESKEQKKKNNKFSVLLFFLGPIYTLILELVVFEVVVGSLEFTQTKLSTFSNQFINFTVFFLVY